MRGRRLSRRFITCFNQCLKSNLLKACLVTTFSSIRSEKPLRAVRLLFACAEPCCAGVSNALALLCRQKPASFVPVVSSSALCLFGSVGKQEEANGCTSWGLHFSLGAGALAAWLHSHCVSRAPHPAPSADRPPAAPVQQQTADAAGEAHVSHPGLWISSLAAVLLRAVVHCEGESLAPQLHSKDLAQRQPLAGAGEVSRWLAARRGGRQLRLCRPPNALAGSEKALGSQLCKIWVHAGTLKMDAKMVVDLLYWRDIKKTGVVFGASLFLLLSLTVFSIVSVTAYIALALLSVTISFRIYKGVIQAIQKSDEGHPFRAYLESDVAVSEELIQKYSNVVLGHINGTVKELRRLFLVDDLVDSLKFAVLMWVFTYVGALFNGLTLLILALISLFSVPVIYERHQAQIDHYLGLVNKNVKDAMAKIQAKIPGLKRKTE
ncbi:reticulon-4 isoform X1 [Calonectris borealis]|uniref:reticulon-4 isoform X1 n=1 Tax=Calonectris borealis TaxID=1323832 RepID=UPI003F4C0418